jgi:hypothetical protein
LSTWEILHELPACIFSWEQGLWLTFWSLWAHPGRLCRDYVGGRRKPYVNHDAVLGVVAGLHGVDATPGQLNETSHLPCPAAPLSGNKKKASSVQKRPRKPLREIQKLQG